MWGLGQRPNCSTGDQYAKRAQQRRRQRSVPASNFAHPQMRPQLAPPTPRTLSRQMGATEYQSFPIILTLLKCRDFATVEATRSLSLAPSTPSARTPMFLVFSCCLPFLAAGGFAPLDAVGHRRSRCCRRNPAGARFQAHPANFLPLNQPASCHPPLGLRTAKSPSSSAKFYQTTCQTYPSMIKFCQKETSCAKCARFTRREIF